jgi:hypothetical protein
MVIGRDMLARAAHLHMAFFRGTGDAGTMDGIYAESFTDHHPEEGQAEGAEGLIAAREIWRGTFPDAHTKTDRVLVQPPFASVRWTMTGTHGGQALMGHPARDFPVRISGGDVVKVRDDGLITDLWHVEELWRLRQQIAGEPVGE